MIGIATCIRVMSSYWLRLPKNCPREFVQRRGEAARLYHLSPPVKYVSGFMSHPCSYVIVSMPSPKRNSSVILFAADADGIAWRHENNGHLARGDWHILLRVNGYEPDIISEACALESERERKSRGEE